VADSRAAAAKLRRAFVTSEGIDLRLQLGSASERAMAFILDGLIIMGAMIGMTIAAIFIAASVGLAAFQLTAILWLLGFFVLRNGYFIAFELGMRAATPGKRMMKLRVVARDGGRLTGEAVIARNLMRELEFFLPFSFLFYAGGDGWMDFWARIAAGVVVLVFLCFPLFNRDRLRVGDLVAGTWVVRVPRHELGRSVGERAAEPRYVFTDAQLAAFALRNGYFIAFELGMRAATPGKRAMKLRVVARDGGRLTGEAVIARNLMRELEFFLPLSFLFAPGGEGWLDIAAKLASVVVVFIFLCFPLFNRDRLRVGDLIAGTWVVHVPRRELGRSVGERAAEPRYVFTDQQLAAYGEFELQKLEEVLRREDELSVIVVARAIRTRIGWTGSEADDYGFLQAYYTALCQRLERGMLFGKRRADKYQKA
jgi:uncharacterized RDD family membrane protein YckC